MRALLDADDPGSCPPTGTCRGFEGLCADLATQFAAVPVLHHPHGLQDWTCTAFPSDATQLDSFLVGLISIAVALPCTLFLSGAFELANDSEAPKSWLEWSGLLPKLLFGFSGHHRWHYTRCPKPPHWLARWYARCWSSPSLELVLDGCEWLKAKGLCRDPAWVTEGRERQAAEAHARKAAAVVGDQPPEDAAAAADNELVSHVCQSGSAASSMADARALKAHKRFLTCAGLLGTALTWALFIWFIFTCALAAPCRLRPRVRRQC